MIDWQADLERRQLEIAGGITWIEPELLAELAKQWQTSFARLPIGRRARSSMAWYLDQLGDA